MSQEDMMRLSRKRSAKEKEDAQETAATKKAVAATPPTATDGVASSEPELQEPSKKQNTKVAEVEKAAPSSKATASAVSSIKPKTDLSDTKTKPAQPQSLVQRSKISAANLDRIAQAMEAYIQDKGKYPPQAVYDSSKAPLLSWRVALLPYLGYQDLYDQFDTTKPWNSPINKQLIAQIPSVYQSPERYDTKTNFLFATGTSTLFPGPRTVSLRRVEDGIEHCALVVEANNSRATTWTKPQEHRVALATPKKDLGELRGGNVFVVWGGGITGAVPMSVPDSKFKAMFTVDGGESFSSYAVSVPLDDEYFASQTNSPAPALASSPVASSANKGDAGSNSRRSFANRRTGAAGVADSLSSEFFDAAKTSYALDQPANALLWYYASNLLQATDASWAQDYGWVPALKRPCPAIHFCIGVEGNAPSTRSRRSVGAKNTRDAERQAIVAQIADEGEQLLSILERHAETLVPSTLATADGDSTKASAARRRSGKRRSNRTTPVSYLGNGSRSELSQLALAKAADVLVLFELKSGTGGSSRWLTVEMIDLARKREILSTSRIPNKAYSSGDATQQLANDELFKKARWQLEDFLEDSLKLMDWPDELKPRHAEARITKLAEANSLNPLTALSEMSVYRNRGLIDTQQLLQGFRSLLGEESGEALMLGSEKKRKRVLRNWLPDVQPSDLQQLASLHRNANDEDD